jgi:hypothetical protein
MRGLAQHVSARTRPVFGVRSQQPEIPTERTTDWARWTHTRSGRRPVPRLRSPAFHLGDHGTAASGAATLRQPRRDASDAAGTAA